MLFIPSATASRSIHWLLLLLLAGGSCRSPRWLAAQAPRARGSSACGYPASADSARALLQRIDYVFPWCVRRVCVKSLKLYRTSFAADSCFSEAATLEPGSLLASPQRQQLLRRGFLTGFSKPIGSVGTIEVLEYRNTAAASTSKAITDSILFECRNRENQAEACVGIDLFRAAQQGRFIVRFNVYSEDPLRRLASREIRASLYANLQ